MPWPSGRASDSGTRGRGFDPHSSRRVVSLNKIHLHKKVLVIPRRRWLRPDMTEKLLTEALSLNPNKQTNLPRSMVSHIVLIVSEHELKNIMCKKSIGCNFSNRTNVMPE